MLHIVIKMRELASSNLNHLMEMADNPAKMLGLLRHELQESIIAAQGALTKTERQADRKAQDAEHLAASEADWAAKAKLALQQEREDLARSALLAREGDRAQAKSLQAEVTGLRAEAHELSATIAELEAKLVETRERIASQSPASTNAGDAAKAGKANSRSERIMDRIATLEKRLGFAEEAADANAAFNAQVDAEIEQMARKARVDEEMAGLKQKAAKPAVRRKAKG